MKCPHLDALIQELSALPAIGQKSARRLAFHFLSLKPDQLNFFINTLKDACQLTRPCNVCGGLTEENPCEVCNGVYSGQGILCVIENASEVEHIRRFLPEGSKIHVLGGKLSPMRGIAPEHLNMENLWLRLKEPGLKEVLIATSPDAEGEATAYYLREKLAASGIATSRLGFGVSFSTSLESADERSIQKSIESRVTYR